LYKMLKGRRSSTPSQRDKDKKGKPLKKEIRSSSTSLLRLTATSLNFSEPALNQRQIGSFPYSTPEPKTNSSSTDSIPNNAKASLDSGEGVRFTNLHWSEVLCETVLLVSNDASALHFEIEGGADDGKFPYVGPIHPLPEEEGITVQSYTSSGTNCELLFLYFFAFILFRINQLRNCTLEGWITFNHFLKIIVPKIYFFLLSFYNPLAR